MTLAKPIFQASGTHSAEEARHSFYNYPAIVEGFEVTVDSPLSMDLNVSAGQAFVEGTEASGQGTYFVRDSASSSVTVPTADATYDRIDLVVLTVRDTAYSGVDDDAVLQVVTGTPSASPSAPTVPDNSIVLATVDVPALASSISAVTDERGRVTYNAGGFHPGLGTAVIVESGSQMPTGPATGLLVLNEQTGALTLENSGAQYVNGPASQKYAVVKPSSNVSIPNNSTTTVSLTSALNMPTGWSLASNAVYVAEAGLYQIDVSVLWQASTATGYRQAYLQIDGSNTYDGRSFTMSTVKDSTNAVVTQHLSAVVELDPSTEVGLSAFQNGGSTQTINASSTHLTVARLA